MTLFADPPPTPSSPLGRLDPRWRLAALLLAAAAVAALRTLPAAAVALGVALGLAGLGRLPRRWLLSRLAALLPFLAPFALLLPFFASRGESWELGPVTLSREGTRLAGLLVAKALALVTLLLVVLATAPLHVTLQAAHCLRVPGTLVQLALLSYRQVFLLADQLRRLRIALRVRGYRNRATRHSYRTIGHVTGTLLVRSQERAERLGQAMRCRGFDGRFRSLAVFRTTARDLLFFCALVGGMALLLYWDA